MHFLVGIGRCMAYCWSYWTCPLRNDRHKYLSLARLAFAGSVAMFLVCAVLGRVSIPATVGFSLLWLLCWGDIATSKLSGDVLRILAARWGVAADGTAMPAHPDCGAEDS